MALRVLRLVIVASIFAFVLIVRTVTPIHAAGGPADDPTQVLVDPSSTVLGEDPPIDPAPPPDPPTEPPPVEAEPPPADPVEPPPTDPPPADPTDAVEPTTEPPVEAEPPPADPVEPAPADLPPADTVATEPPTEPPVEAEPPPTDPVPPAPTDPPADTVETVPPPADPPIDSELPPVDAIEPAPTDPPLPDTIPPPLTDPSAVIDDRAISDRSATGTAPSVPSTHRASAPAPHLPVTDNSAQPATESVVAFVSTQTGRMESVEPDRATAFAPAIAAGAGLAAGIALTNHAPSSVAVAIEFGRAGGGWAGALVFNLWLRRQMRERRMSQRRLADLAGVDHSTISRLLRQDRRPSLTTATKLARALKQVPGDQAEPEAADYFERIPDETVFPARRVELALRADELLDDEQVRRLMNMYLDARRRTEAAASTGSAGSGAAPARAAPDARR